MNQKHLGDFLDSGIKALEKLKSERVIAAYGLGVNETQVCLDVMARTSLDCILLAGRYTLLDRAASAELLPLCRKAGTSLVIGGVFNSGILATGPVEDAHFDYGPADDNILQRVGRLQDIAGNAGVPLAAAALQFPLRDSAVATVLVGTAKAESLRRNLDLIDAQIPSSAWSAFDSAAINT